MYSLFSEKLPSLNTTSSSINFILTNFSDIPTKIDGKIELNNGLIIFNNIIFHNETGKSYQIPVIESKEGPNVLDIRKLYEETVIIHYNGTFDNMFMLLLFPCCTTFHIIDK